MTAPTSTEGTDTSQNSGLDNEASPETSSATKISGSDQEQILAAPPETPAVPQNESAPVPISAGSNGAAVSRPVVATPTRITVAAAGIDVRVLPLSLTTEDLASQSIVPPFTDDGYWISSYGAPGVGSTDTTYITGHSWEGREAPFDRFSTHASVGDVLTLTTTAGTMNYVIDAVTTHDKDSLKTSAIWDVVPNRVVIISCYTEDPWGKNVIATASPVG
nr:sortase [Arthrobacter sp. Br18]